MEEDDTWDLVILKVYCGCVAVDSMPLSRPGGCAIGPCVLCDHPLGRFAGKRGLMMRLIWITNGQSIVSHDLNMIHTKTEKIGRNLEEVVGSRSREVFERGDLRLILTSLDRRLQTVSGCLFLYHNYKYL